MKNPPAMISVEIERGTQDAKWGEQNHDAATWALILGEEFGEACQASLEYRFGDSEKPAPSTEEALNLLRYELVQTAAVAVAWIEAIDRGYGR